MGQEITNTPELPTLVRQEIDRRPAKDIITLQQEKSMSLAKIRKGGNMTIVTEIIILLIHEVKSMVNTSPEKNLSERQAIKLADEVYREFYHLSISEIKFAFNEGRNGNYKIKIFDRVDPSMFLSWLTEYDNERFNMKSGEPVKIHNTESKEVFQAIEKVSKGLHLKLYLAKKKREEERKQKFEHVITYCNTYGLNGPEIDKELEEYFEIMYERDVIMATFVDQFGNPSILRYKKHCFIRVLNQLHHLRPKTKEDIFRIVRNMSL